jgi:hypothetical protein
MKTNTPDRHFVIIFDSGVEKAVACTHDELKDRVQEAVRKAGITTPRTNPADIEIKVEEFKVDNDMIVRRPYTILKVRPPLTRMTQAEFDAEQADLLTQLPEAFHSAFKSHAWDDGHSSGLEAVTESLRCLIDEMLPSIKAFESELKLSIMNHAKGLVPETKKP